MPVLPCLDSVGRGAHGVGGRRCPPPGGFQSAGHQRCANSVLNSFPTGSVQSQLANLDILSSISIWSVLSPILSFPQEPGDHRNPTQKNRFLCLVGPSWSFYSPFQPRLKNDIEKTSKKMRKSRNLSSQSRPKPLSKSYLF